MIAYSALSNYNQLLEFVILGVTLYIYMRARVCVCVSVCRFVSVVALAMCDKTEQGDELRGSLVMALRRCGYRGFVCVSEGCA